MLLYRTVIPPNTADLGTDEKAAVFEKPAVNGKESYISKKNLIWDLKMGGGMGGAVNRGAVWGGLTTVSNS